MNVFRTASALSALLSLAGTARAQVADCDYTQGLVDLYVHVRFEDFADCPPGPCTQDPDEENLVGWGVTLVTLGGAFIDEGTTDADGLVRWAGNADLKNACVPYGQYSATLSPPIPSPYDAEALWPSDLTFELDADRIDPEDGQILERQEATLAFGCACVNDLDACTSNACRNGRCPYAPLPFDPTAPEVCNDRDDDCDGAIDEGLPDAAAECSDATAIGCADKTREGFTDWRAYPLIAACGGAWSEAGLDLPASCARGAGNHGATPDGEACAAVDLCAPGWHVCRGPDDVAQRLGDGDCRDAMDASYPNFGTGVLASDVEVPPGAAFFASAARVEGDECVDSVGGSGAGAPAAAVFGCGNLGADGDASCGPLDRVAGPACGGLRDLAADPGDATAVDFGYGDASAWGWSCESGDELGTLVKSLPDRQGGVLCCRDTDPSLPEVCDGLDNDADGTTDEGELAGRPVVAGGVCRAGDACGRVTCSARGGWSCLVSGACSEDAVCDGVDDDGDGATDEDHLSIPTTCGVGVCAATGELRCVDGEEVDDCAPKAPDEPTDVTCDWLDGDCDGDTDEDFQAPATRCGVGACTGTGVATCVFGERFDSCVPGTPLGADDASCDGVDQDCDGADGEDLGARATSCGVGACASTGSERCADGALVDTCVPGAAASRDAICDGIDEDCDGAVDEEVVAVETTCGVGACASTGNASCVAGVIVDNCQPRTDCDGTSPAAAEDAGCAGGRGVGLSGLVLALVALVSRRARAPSRSSDAPANT